MEKISDLDIGRAGEYLVCADLILSGHNAFLSDQGLPFDVVAIINGKVMRVQVKTTQEKKPIPQRKKHTPAYLFHLRRCGKGGRRSYDDTDFDFMALVALDIKRIAYINLQECRQTLHINEENFMKLGDVMRAVNYVPPPTLFDRVDEAASQPDMFVQVSARTEVKQESLGL